MTRLASTEVSRSRLGRLYYFRTTVYRFLVLASVGNRFERRALHIDSRIAEPSGLTFLLYVNALRWAITDAALFHGVESYSEAEALREEQDAGADREPARNDRVRRLAECARKQQRQRAGTAVRLSGVGAPVDRTR